MYVCVCDLFDFVVLGDLIVWLNHVCVCVCERERLTELLLHKDGEGERELLFLGGRGGTPPPSEILELEVEVY